MKTLKPYCGTYHGEKSARGRRCFLLGFQFGAVLLTVGASEEEALDEFDERHGERVGDYATDSALRDYGPDAEKAIDAAMNDGDIRMNDGGTTVWVDHYEWMKEFPNATEAMRFLRSR